MERGAHPQLDAGELEDVPPDAASEHRIVVADDQHGEAVEPDNVVKEGFM